MVHKVILKSLKHPEQVIVLTECSTYENARQSRDAWRRTMGNRWIVDRRPGLDTLNNNLALTIITEGQ